MTYYEVALIPVPEANKDTYIRHSQLTVPIFKECGALSVVDCWGETVPEGDVTSMPTAVQLKPGETVVYSHIAWPSKAARDEGMAKAMEKMQSMKELADTPFDGKRAIFGSFELVSGA